MRTRFSAVLVLAVSLAACSPYDPPSVWSVAEQDREVYAMVFPGGENEDCDPDYLEEMCEVWQFRHGEWHKLPESQQLALTPLLLQPNQRVACGNVGCYEISDLAIGFGSGTEWELSTGRADFVERQGGLFQFRDIAASGDLVVAAAGREGLVMLTDDGWVHMGIGLVEPTRTRALFAGLGLEPAAAAFLIFFGAWLVVGLWMYFDVPSYQQTTKQGKEKVKTVFGPAWLTALLVVPLVSFVVVFMLAVGSIDGSGNPSPPALPAAIGIIFSFGLVSFAVNNRIPHLPPEHGERVERAMGAFWRGGLSAWGTFMLVLAGYTMGLIDHFEPAILVGAGASAAVLALTMRRRIPESISQEV